MKPTNKSYLSRLTKVLGFSAASLIAMTLATTVSAADLRLKFAGVLPVDHEGTKMMKQIEKDIEAANVGLKMSVYPANQLGSGEALLEDTIRGSIDFSMGFLYPIKDPKLDVLNTPFLVSNWEEMQSVMRNPNSNFRQALDERADKIGIKVLNANPEGFVGIVANKKPSDWVGTGDKGMNIRVWSSNTVKNMVETLGYQATTLAWGEIFPSLQNGIVDGAICCTKQATYTIFAKSGVGKYFVEYNTIVEQSYFYASAKTWEKLNEEQRQVVTKAFQKASDDYFAFNKVNDVKFAEKLIESGYEILTPNSEQQNAMVKHVRTEIWPQIEENVGKDIMDRIKADLN